MPSSIPLVYQGTVPTQTQGGLSPLQLAVANYFIQNINTGQNPPFSVNQDWIKVMQTFVDSGMLTPANANPYTGNPYSVIIAPGITGIRYIMVGEDVYLLRRAQDCGPDENRLEKILIGKRAQVAEGTFAYYGRVIIGGSAAGGSGDISSNAGGASDGADSGSDGSAATGGTGDGGSE